MNVRLFHQVANQPHAPASPVSSPIRRKLIRLQEIADEVDLRAETLQWMMESFPTRGQDTDLVRTLRETAARLRWAAFRLGAPSRPEEERSSEAS